MSNQEEQPDGEPEVGDWSQPTAEESKKLLGISPEELADLVQMHPQIARFVRLGIEAIRQSADSERATAFELAAAYYALTQNTIDGLLKRLSEPGVTEAETNNIYALLNVLEARVAAKDTEHQEANAKLGDKERRYLGLFAAFGLVLTVALVTRGSGPTGALGGRA